MSVASSQPIEPGAGLHRFLWAEHVPPSIMIEYSSEDGSKERDRTPYEGKFWIYEQAVRGRY